MKERIRKIPYLQYHAIRESNPRQMCHETLISYSIRSFWIILIEGISSWESLCKPDHEFNVTLPGVTKTSEYGEIEEIRRWRPSFCEITHLTFYKIQYSCQWILLKFRKLTKHQRQRIIKNDLLREKHKLLYLDLKNSNLLIKLFIIFSISI